MKICSKRCAYCGRWFRPRAQSAKHQKFCSRRQCQLARRRRKLRRWRKLHPDKAKKYAPKVRAWAAAYPNYWRHYRKTHRQYAHQDNDRRKKAMKASRRSAKETGWKSIAVEKLQAIAALRRQKCSAKETGWPRRVEAIEEYLLSTAQLPGSANRNRMAMLAEVAG